MDHVITELCNKMTILQTNYRNTTILWSFFYNSFVKFHNDISLNQCYALSFSTTDLSNLRIVGSWDILVYLQVMRHQIM